MGSWLPALSRVWTGEIRPLDVEALAGDVDVVFLALPDAAAAELAPGLVDAGVRVVDLSGVTGEPPNARVALDVDVPTFTAMLLEAIEAYE